MAARSILCLVVGTAAAALPAALVGQEAQQISYSDVMSRLQRLESEQARFHEAGLHYGGDEGYDSPTCSCDSGCRPNGWYVLYENVIVQPYFSRNTAYLIDNNGYQEVSFNQDYSYSPRIELGYIPDCGGLGGRLRYFHFDNDTSLTANDPGGNIFVAFADDSSPDIGLLGVADAQLTHSLKLDVVDLEAAYRDCDWTYSAGLRYVRMDQNYDGTELNTVTPDRFLSGHNFEGYGPTMAAEVLKPWRGNISVFAKARGSFLYGESDFLAFNPDETERLINSNREDLLAIGEMQMGVDWRRCLSSGRVFFVTLALEGQYWFNAGTGAPTNNAPFDEGNYQSANPLDADMGLLGLSAATGLVF